MDCIEVLKQSTVDGCHVKLPDIQLDRKDYEAVKAALEKIGGKWKGGKTAAFVFASDPSELLERLTGGEKVNLKKEYQYFPTPEHLCRRMLGLAAPLYDGMRMKVLEPSAGQGAIIRELNAVGIEPDCYEIMPQNILALKKSGLRFTFEGEDFLEAESIPMYDRIIANPPFAKSQDIDHVLKMYDMLRPGGILVTVMSTSCMGDNTKKKKDFQWWLKNLDHDVEDVPAGTFKESGTGVSAILVTIRKSM